jgi:hypothetical protein
MLNRPTLAPRESLDARVTVTGPLRALLNTTPASPFDWATFDPSAALRNDGASLDMRLGAMTRLMCTAPSRSAELRALWNESVVTAAYALRLAPHLGGDAHTSAIAGLLHRLGDLLTLRGLATVEHASSLRLDAASKADLCAEHSPEQLDRAVRAWGVPPRAAVAAAQWRRLCEFPGTAADATAVHLARLIAIELLSPQFCAPGMVDHAAEEAGLPSRALSEVRSDATIAKLLATLQ